MLALKTLKETAPCVRCSEITLRRLIRTRKIGCKKVGRRFLFSDDDISEYLQRVQLQPVGVEDESPT